MDKIEQRLDDVEAQSDVNSNTGRFIERFMWIVVAAGIGLLVYFTHIEVFMAINNKVGSRYSWQRFK